MPTGPDGNSVCYYPKDSAVDDATNYTTRSSRTARIRGDVRRRFIRARRDGKFVFAPACAVRRPDGRAAVDPRHPRTHRRGLLNRPAAPRRFRVESSICRSRAFTQGGYNKCFPGTGEVQDSQTSMLRSASVPIRGHVSAMWRSMVDHETISRISATLRFNRNIEKSRGPRA